MSDSPSLAPLATKPDLRPLPGTHRGVVSPGRAGSSAGAFLQAQRAVRGGRAVGPDALGFAGGALVRHRLPDRELRANRWRARPFTRRHFRSSPPTSGRASIRHFTPGCLEFAEVTSWYEPVLASLDDLSVLQNDPFANPYFKKIEELTRAALARCDNRYWVGYTDLHPSLDCIAAWRGIDALCLDMAVRTGEARAAGGTLRARFPPHLRSLRRDAEVRRPTVRHLDQHSLRRQAPHPELRRVHHDFHGAFHAVLPAAASSGKCRAWTAPFIMWTARAWPGIWT